MTLASYERSGLLNYFDEACVVFPESAGKVCETALSYGLSAESSPAEGGFIGALHTAVNALDTDYVLLAEDDCMIWEHLRGETLENQLKRAVELLISGQADMVRLRHAWRGCTRYKAAYTYSYFYPVEQLATMWVHAEGLSGSTGLDQEHPALLPSFPLQAFHRPMRLCGTKSPSALSRIHYQD